LVAKNDNDARTTTNGVNKFDFALKFNSSWGFDEFRPDPHEVEPEPESHRTKQVVFSFDEIEVGNELEFLIQLAVGTAGPAYGLGVFIIGVESFDNDLVFGSQSHSDDVSLFVNHQIADFDAVLALIEGHEDEVDIEEAIWRFHDEGTFAVDCEHIECIFADYSIGLGDDPADDLADRHCLQLSRGTILVLLVPCYMIFILSEDEEVTFVAVYTDYLFV
jgi:hypothetical protein